MKVRWSAYRLLVPLCLAWAAVSCVPGREEMVTAVREYALPADVEQGTGVIYISDALPSQLWYDRTVLCDGDDETAKIGNLSPKSYLYVRVAPGHHRIRMPEWSPYELVVEVEEGDILFLQPAVDMKKKKNIIRQVDGVLGRYLIKLYKPGDRSTAAERKHGPSAPAPGAGTE